MPSRRGKNVDHQILTPEVAFGQIVREKRVSLGLRQIDLEAEDGISRVHISRIEAGKTQVCLRGILQIGEALEIPPSELIAELSRRLGAKSKR